MENHRILIVEDDEAIAGAVSRIIESWGLTPRCVRDFRDVLREFTDFDPHLVLMDITLPFFNGYHWCNEIRKISAVPIIFVSSASENMNIVMAVDMGGDDFIAKPFDPSVLMAKIRAVLRRTYDLGDRVPVHAVPPRDLAEVRLRAGPPVDVQLSHYVSLHIPLLPGRIPDRSIVPLAQLVKVR